MAHTSQKKSKTKKISKKEARKQIEQKLTRALADLQKEMGEKRFQTSVKKASKLFSVKIPKKTKKEDKVKTVKAVPKAEAPALNNA
jgi:hypothetical protein